MKVELSHEEIKIVIWALEACVAMGHSALDAILPRFRAADSNAGPAATAGPNVVLTTIAHEQAGQYHCECALCGNRWTADELGDCPRCGGLSRVRRAAGAAGAVGDR